VGQSLAMDCAVPMTLVKCQRRTIQKNETKKMKLTEEIT